VVYNVEMLKEMLDGRIDTLHFDEAWLPHAAFHDFYRDMHAIGPRQAARAAIDDLRDAVHPQAAGGPLAGSQILVRESESRKLNSHVFNELI